MKKSDLLKLQLFLDTHLHSKRKVEYVHGFLASIICAPETLMPSQWISSVLGEGDEMPEYNSQEEAQEIISIVMELYNDVADTLNDETFVPLLTLDHREPTHEDARIWCKGFFLGLHFWGVNIQEMDDEVTRLMLPLIVLGDVDMFLDQIRQGLDLDDNTGIDVLKEFSFDNLANTVIELRHYIMSLTKPEYSDFTVQDPVEHYNNDKVGRNDPCPCGSGLKYKKCCGG
jgi:uncharacterized protein